MTNDTRTLDEMAVDTVAKLLAEFDAAAPPTTPLPTTEQQLDAARFREHIAQHALLHGVRPAAVKHVLREAETVFALHDGELVPRDGQTDPNDPLSPLTPARWLQQLASTDAFLFQRDGRSH